MGYSFVHFGSWSLDFSQQGSWDRHGNACFQMFSSSTVPFKCKLTVSTRNSILDPRSFWESRIKFRGSSFEFQFSRFENQVLRIEFRDARRIFQGSRTEISRKRFNSRKQNNSDEQNNWRAALFAETRCWMYANIFSCCAFSTRHMWFAYLPRSWWQQTSLASKCIYNVSCRNERLLFARLQPGASVLFSFARIQPAAQNVNKR